MTRSNDMMDVKELRKFGLMMGTVIGALFGIVLPWLFGRGFPLWPWPVAAGLIAWATFHAKSLMPVYRIWMKVGHVLGWINTRIILGIAFFLLFFPVGLIMRLLGKDPMKRTFKDSGSYRVISDNLGKEHIERPY